MGKSGAGKDTVQNAFCESFKGETHKIVSTTTRPPRDAEIEGSDYFFVNAEEFANKVLNYEMVEASDFRDWFYGTELKALDENKINIGVFNPDGIRALKEDSRIELLVIYVTASDKTRLSRVLNREAEPDIEEMFRRYRTDKDDFDGLDFDFEVLTNENTNTLEGILGKARNLVYQKFGQKKKCS